MSDVIGLLVLMALLLGNAFFVAAEFALVTARPDQLEPRAAAGSARARTTIRAMRNVSQMMAGAQPASRSARSASARSVSPRWRT